MNARHSGCSLREETPWGVPGECPVHQRDVNREARNIGNMKPHCALSRSGGVRDKLATRIVRGRTARVASAGLTVGTKDRRIGVI
jgi:hypothetical protein